MSNPIFDPAYWKQRLADATMRERSWAAVYDCTESVWEAVKEQHRKILARHVFPLTSILDVGCGWGRMLDLLPATWHGTYVGIDLSPDFIEIARHTYGGRGDGTFPQFRCMDVRMLPPSVDRKFDLAICISLRSMVLSNAGLDEWSAIYDAVKRCAKEFLILEYEADGEGFII